MSTLTSAYLLDEQAVYHGKCDDTGCSTHVHRHLHTHNQTSRLSLCPGPVTIVILWHVLIRLVVQVTPYQEDEVVLVCSKEHPLSGCRYVTKEQLRELKYVSLFQSSTVKAIKNTLIQHNIQLQALQVVLVSHLPSCSQALTNSLL